MSSLITRCFVQSHDDCFCGTFFAYFHIDGIKTILQGYFYQESGKIVTTLIAPVGALIVPREPKKS
jgi:hypothetical protein